LAVHIPVKACNLCKQTGWDWFDAADQKTFDMAMLQDRSTGQFTKKSLK
jgi:hypothetical protein